MQVTSNVPRVYRVWKNLKAGEEGWGGLSVSKSRLSGIVQGWRPVITYFSAGDLVLFASDCGQLGSKGLCVWLTRKDWKATHPAARWEGWGCSSFNSDLAAIKRSCTCWQDLLQEYNTSFLTTTSLVRATRVYPVENGSSEKKKSIKILRWIAGVSGREE